MVILDNSAAIEIVAGSERGRAMSPFILEDEQVVSCELMRIEAASTARKYKRQYSLTFEQAQQMMASAISLVDDFVPIEELEEEAFRESIRLDHPVYDMLYFVLARRTGGTLFSTDKALVNLCEQNGVECVHQIDL